MCAQQTRRLGLALMGVTALVAYPFAGRCALPAQIFAHLMLPVAAEGFKLGDGVVLAGVHAADRACRASPQGVMP
jgi:hypothetical protein